MPGKRIYKIEAREAELSNRARMALLAANFDGTAWALHSNAPDVVEELGKKIVQNVQGCIRITGAGMKLRAQVVRMNYKRKKIHS